MRGYLGIVGTGVLVALLATGGAESQPVDGDLIVGLSVSNPGIVLWIQPASQRATILLREPDGLGFSDLQMDADNTAMIFGTSDHRTPNGPSYVMRLGLTGALRTLGTITSVQSPGILGLELDHDGWILAGAEFTSKDWLWHMPTGGGSITTLYGTTSTNPVLEITVDRDPGSWPYAIMRGGAASPAAWIQAMDRNGVIATLATSPWPRSGDIAFDARMGDYVVASNDLMRMSKGGAFTTLVKATTGVVFAVSLLRDGTAWTAGFEAGSLVIHRVDQHGVVLSRMVFPNYSNSSFTGFFVYGDRRLVCSGSGKPGSRVTVNLQSRQPGDGGKPYALACSFGRRPGIPVGGRGAINLQPGELFYLSAGGLVPSIFQRFQGTTDGQGNAVAWINLPTNLPPSLGITVFVAGVIYDMKAIRTVTNAHWFVLS